MFLSSGSTSRPPRKITKRPKRNPMPAFEQSAANIHQSGESLSQADDKRSNFKPQVANHIRRSSASAVVYQPRHDQRLLTPTPWAPSYRTYIMSSAAGPAPAYHMRYDPFVGRDNSTRDFVSASRSRFVVGDQSPAPRPMRIPPRPPGAYTQFENRPMMHEQPGRRSSGSSNGSTAMTRDSFEARMRSPASSRTSLESWDSHPKRVEYGWQRPAPIKQYRRKAQPGELLDALPGEVIELILNELRSVHLAAGSSSCATCMMRDLCSVALSSRKLLGFARGILYENIQLIGSDSNIQKKRYKIAQGSRMVLLRRTLRSSPQIAALVHSLKLPIQPLGMAKDDYLNLVASVIMACPNLERLAGPHQNYNHDFNRLFHALSTRNKLKEVNWIVEPSPHQGPRRVGSGSDAASISNAAYLTPGNLHPQHSNSFLELNMNWASLTMLSIHCLEGASLTPVSLIPAALSYMPALQNLRLSNLQLNSFNDTSLLSLPALKTLSLSCLPGVTSAGLSSFATRHSSRSLRKLTLQHINLDSLPVLARMCSNLVALETFNLVQYTAPILPEHEMIWLFPYLASPNLRTLHWDITSNKTCTSMADSILAKSIASSGFPSLRTLRVPNDPDGLFQNLCRPVEHMERPKDRYLRGGLVSNATNARLASLGKATSPGESPNSQQFPAAEATVSSNLAEARVKAQDRIEAARKYPRFTVNVIDEDGILLEKFGMAGFMGTTESQIRYCLTPDPGATDEGGGLVQMSDALKDSGEDLTRSEGCTGRWNTYGGNTADRRDRERWWHEERGSWREVSLF